MAKYVIEMEYKGQWRRWNETDDKAQAERMVEAARVTAPARIVVREGK